MTYLRRRKWELLGRSLLCVWSLWFSVKFAYFMLTENPKIEYLTATIITVFWLCTCWFAFDMAKAIWKIIKENIDVYETQESGR